MHSEKRRRVARELDSRIGEQSPRRSRREERGAGVAASGRQATSSSSSSDVASWKRPVAPVDNPGCNVEVSGGSGRKRGSPREAGRWRDCGLPANPLVDMRGGARLCLGIDTF